MFEEIGMFNFTDQNVLPHDMYNCVLYTICKYI